MTFPETTGRLPQTRRPLAFRQVVGIVYVFGGIAGVLTLLSKFVVQPLHDQLTFDRRVYATEARHRLEKLNSQIEKIVSEVPQFENRRRGYVDTKTQATPESRDQFLRRKPRPQNWAEFNALFNTDEILGNSDENPIVNITEEFTQSLRQMMYNKGYYLGPKGSELFGSKLSNDTPLRNATSELMKEIRSFKGALLSI